MKVRCILGNGSLIEGKIYQLVRKEKTRGQEYYIILDNGRPSDGWFAKRFVRASEYDNEEEIEEAK